MIHVWRTPLRFFWISCHSCLRETGSSPAVGSSKNTTLLSPIKDIPTQTRRFWPPLSVPQALVFFSGKPRSCAMFSTWWRSCEPRVPLIWPNSHRWNSRLRSSQSTSCWKQIPRLRLAWVYIRSVRIYKYVFTRERWLLWVWVYWHVMGDASDITGYDRRTRELSNAALHIK